MVRISTGVEWASHPSQGPAKPANDPEPWPIKNVKPFSSHASMPVKIKLNLQLLVEAAYHKSIEKFIMALKFRKINKIKITIIDR